MEMLEASNNSLLKSARSSGLSKSLVHGFSGFLAFSAGRDLVFSWFVYVVERMQYLHFLFTLIVLLHKLNLHIGANVGE